MSDADIKTLAARLRNQIISTGIGQYKLSATNPAQAGETWVQVGGAITDTRNTLSDTSYTGQYTGNWVGSTIQYAGAYTHQWSKQYLGEFNQQYVALHPLAMERRDP